MGGASEDSFLEPLGLLLGLTAVVALACAMVKQSTIVAFILVGIIVNASGVHPDQVILGHFSEVGIIVLLYMAGLEVELEAFMKSWKRVLIIGMGQILLCTVLYGTLALVILPWIKAEVNVESVLYFGLCMTFSSTILVLAYLKSSKAMNTIYGRLCLGTLVLQDAVSVLGIAVLDSLKVETACEQINKISCVGANETQCGIFGDGCMYKDGSCLNACNDIELSSLDPDTHNITCSSVGGTGVCALVVAESGSIIVAFAVLFAKLAAVIVILLILAKYVLGPLFEKFASSLELLYFGSLGYCVGLAAIAAKANFSGEITAFLAGVSLTELPYKLHIVGKMEPIKSLGVAMFFCALGLRMPLDEKMLAAIPAGIVLALVAIVTTLPLFMVLGYAARLKAYNTFMIGTLMSQISEFSLILCSLCVRANVFDEEVLTVFTVAAVISIVVSSLGHQQVDWLWRFVQRRWFFQKLDAHYRRGHARHASMDSTATGDRRSTRLTETQLMEMGVRGSRALSDAPFTESDDGEGAVPPKPPGLVEEWDDEAKELAGRTTVQLKADLKKVDAAMAAARLDMATTAEEKRRHHAPSIDAIGAIGHHKLATSHATDIVHGLIEGYVIVDDHLTFCTLRCGRMLFWEHQHDVGHVPPTTVWDVSGMTFCESKDIAQRTHTDEDGNEIVEPWEWTIRLAHIHRTEHAYETGDDPMKLEIHGLEDHSDHDYEDWRDALSVAMATLNPIALRRAHIKEALMKQSKRRLLSRDASFADREEIHAKRDRIICIGYNELFPAVLALADAMGKRVVVIEYDPSKIKAVKKLYGKRGKDDKRGTMKKSGVTAEEEAAAKKVSQQNLLGVKCEYADIHDPEAWEETEMDEAFMVVGCMHGVQHALAAIATWLKKHSSKTMFVGATRNNAEALELYESGADFVLQADALARRAAKDLFLDSLAKIGDASQMRITGRAHAARLKKLKNEGEFKFNFETGV